MGRRTLGIRLAEIAIAADAARPAIASMIALVIWGAGCSFLFSEGPPVGYQRRDYFDCGESYAPPVLDSAAAALFGLAALGTSRAQPRPAGADTTLAVQAGFALVAGLSAVYGYVAVDSCQSAKETRAVELARARRLPAPYDAPPAAGLPASWPPGPP